MNNRQHFVYNLLISLLGIFAFRVIAQLIQYFSPLPFLPEFERWQSGALPYCYLLLLQAVILLVGFRTIYRIKLGVLTVSRKMAKILLALGGLYAIAMLVRLAVGIFLPNSSPWFSAYIPIFFHLILACWILTLSRYHYLSSS